MGTHLSIASASVLVVCLSEYAIDIDRDIDIAGAGAERYMYIA